MLVNFIYDHLGRHVAPQSPSAWATTNCFHIREKKKSGSAEGGLRGPGRYQVLVAESGVWVHASNLVPRPEIELPPHIHWEVGEITPQQRAMRSPRELGQWYGVTFSNSGWVSDGQINRPANALFTWYVKSGTAQKRWNQDVLVRVSALLRELNAGEHKPPTPAVLMQIQKRIALGEIGGMDSQMKPYHRMSDSQRLAAKRLYLLLQRETPDILAGGSVREICALAEAAHV